MRGGAPGCASSATYYDRRPSSRRGEAQHRNWVRSGGASTTTDHRHLAEKRPFPEKGGARGRRFAGRGQGAGPGGLRSSRHRGRGRLRVPGGGGGGRAWARNRALGSQESWGKAGRERGGRRGRTEGPRFCAQPRWPSIGSWTIGVDRSQAGISLDGAVREKHRKILSRTRWRDLFRRPLQGAARKLAPRPVGGPP